LLRDGIFWFVWFVWLFRKASAIPSWQSFRLLGLSGFSGLSRLSGLSGFSGLFSFSGLFGFNQKDEIDQSN
jgi:hypothetical protein